MRLGFEAKRLFTNITGLGNYGRTLVSELSKHFPSDALVLFTSSAERNPRTEFLFTQERTEIVSRQGTLSSLWRLWGQGASAARLNLNLYHGLSNELPLDARQAGVPLLVTIHDVLFRRFPNQFGFLNRDIYDFKFKSACRRADVVIAISEATRQDIEEYYKVPKERVKVVYQSCGELFFKKVSDVEKFRILQKYQLPSEYLLCVGSVIERKNLLAVVKALETLKHRLPLVVVGRGGSYLTEVQGFIAARKLTNRVLFKPDIEYCDLPAVYQSSACSVYVSLGEGFGIPVLESLAGGTPAVTSNLSSMPEAGGDAALLVKPSDHNAIGHAISRILEDNLLRVELISKGIKHAQNFHSRKVTQDLMNVYKSLL